MSEYTQDQYDQLPEFIQADFVKVGETYKHAGVVKMKETLNGLNSEKEQAQSKLAEIEKAKAEAIEAARAEAYEKAKAENNVEEILRIERDKLADKERRLGETQTQFEARLDKAAQSQRKSIAQSLAGKLSVEDGEQALEALVIGRITVDALTGQETFLNADGSASSLNKEQFIEELKKDKLFTPLIRHESKVSGGGNINGSQLGSASGSQKNQADKWYK